MKRSSIIAGMLILTGLAAAAWYWTSHKSPEEAAVSRELQPQYKDLTVYVSTTGTVQPRNRLEIIPPLNGRIEKVFVTEGSLVKAGQTLAVMSSTDRATLLDAARSEGPEKVSYWEEVYKPTPLIAPINSKVIVRDIEPGQTVGTAKPVLVLADLLIVKAQLDETDIGHIEKGQEVKVSLDAYPDISVQGRVDHISYESQVVNNVTIYEVDIVLDSIPPVFRSGMSADVKIIRESRPNTLTVPVDAVYYKENKPFVYLKDSSPRGYRPVPVTAGISEDGDMEILSGIDSSSTVVIAIQDKNALKRQEAKSFFTRPGNRRRR